MAVRKMFGAWYVDFRFNRKRIRKKSPEDSKRGAEAFETLLKSKLVRGEPMNNQEKEGITYSDFAENWFNTYVLVNNKPTTRRAKRNHLDRHLCPKLGHLKLSDISSLKVEKLKAGLLKNKLSPKTVNNILSTLRASLHSAEEWNLLEKTPRIKWLKVGEQPFRFLHEEDCERLLRASDDELIHDMVLVALHTGMRRGELIAVMWNTVDFARRKISVEQSYVEGNLHSTKNNKIRHIPMTNEVFSILKTRKRSSGFVFSENEKMLESITASKKLYRLCDTARMDRIGWHVLRHTFASNLVMRGVPMRAIQMLLGHSTIQMTERYAHLAPQALHDAVAVLDIPDNVQIPIFGQYTGSRIS